MEFIYDIRNNFRPLQQVMMVIIPIILITTVVMMSKKRLLAGAALLIALVACVVALIIDYFFLRYKEDIDTKRIAGIYEGNKNFTGERVRERSAALMNKEQI